ncbi:sulfatase-like hydrolase/transferase [Sphingomonas flavalba]|uniref:sulfatase-like hydrolase/transferase n=1 Tax=Sphingomonas flavalba TaxID=2559804 RepID=UPI0039DF9343
MANQPDNAAPAGKSTDFQVIGGAGMENARLGAWLILWIALPNAALALLWMIGSPPRYPEIIATGLIGLTVRRAKPLVIAFAFAATMVYSILQFISRLFNLSPVELATSARFLTELRPSEAPVYIGVFAVVVATLLAGALAARNSMAFIATRSLLIAAAATLLLAAVDFLVVSQNKGSYKRDAPDNAAFQSGVRQSGFLAHTGEGRHLILIAVEAMGAPRDHMLTTRLFAPLQADAVAARYLVTQGTSLFYGSTTNAEIRELCGRWGRYDPLLEKADSTCLPFRLARQHYQTTAIHSFDAGFFDRARWYPKVGFQHMLFRDALLQSGVTPCPGLFPGACDRDIPALIARRLKTAPQSQFIYWLTLNSHFPVPSLAALHTARCTALGKDLSANRPMVCRMFKLWHEVFAGLAREITAADFPEADILIVGDHRPPYYDRKQREMFETDTVPWLLLRARRRRPVSRRKALPGLSVDTSGRQDTAAVAMSAHHAEWNAPLP